MRDVQCLERSGWRVAVRVGLTVCVIGAASAPASAEWAVRLVAPETGAFQINQGAVTSMRVLPVFGGGGVDVAYADPRTRSAYRHRFTEDVVSPESVMLPLANSLHVVPVVDDFGGFSFASVGNQFPDTAVTVGNQIGPDLTDPASYHTYNIAFGSENPSPEIQGPLVGSWPFSYELDRQGLPVIASWTAEAQIQSNVRYLWHYNPQTDRWDRRVPPQLGPQNQFPPFNTLAPQGVGFLPDNRVVFANTSDNLLSVHLEDPVLGWREIAFQEDLWSRSGVSLAVSDAGEVAFAFSDDTLGGLTVGIYDGQQTVYENVSGASQALLGQHSLAYDPEGNLALVYSEPDQEDELVLARRSGPGAWNATPLGVYGNFGFYGELAFGDDGEIYVGAVVGSGTLFNTPYLALISNRIAPLRGDMNFDDTVDLDDVLAFITALEDPALYWEGYGLDPVLKGDLNGDGLFNFSDVEPFVAELGLTDPAAQGLLNLVPEPTTAGLLAAGWAGLLVRGRRRRG
ncbi:MAG: PEP-CTERM sorting domain-containing protein [Planctomycetota bacterium]